MRPINTLKAAAMAAFVALLAVACDDDTELQPGGNTGIEPETPALHTDDIIQTKLNGKVALMGNEFDDVTERIMTRATEVTQSIDNFFEISRDTKYLFIDAPSLARYMSDITAHTDELDYLRSLYMNGLTICMHEPDDLYGFGMMFIMDIIDLKAEIEENGAPATANKISTSASRYKNDSKKLQTRSGEEYGNPDATCDLWAIRRGSNGLFIPDLHKSGATYTVNMSLLENEGMDNEARRDSTITYTPVEPTPYQYGLFAEQAVKWLNEGEDESKSKISSIMSRNPDMSFDEVASSTYLINATAGWSWADRKVASFDWKCPNTNAIIMPIRVSTWITAVYNFDKDEDYYHIVMEESIDASKIYFGLLEWPEVSDFKTYSGLAMTPYAAGATFYDMTIATHWPYSNYTLVNEWNIQPNEGATPSATETVQGWSLNSDISFGKGVSGKLTGSYTTKTTVTTVNQDVTVNTSSNQTIDGASNWIKWYYKFANQLTLSTNKTMTSLNKLTTIDANATSHSLKAQRQSWNWLVGNTSRRGDDPFVIPFKFESVRFQSAIATKLLTVSLFNSHTGVDVSTIQSDFVLSEPVYNIVLPVPERVRKKYTLEVEKIWDEKEYESLMNNLDGIPEFKQLRSKLTALDASNKAMPPTGVTESKLDRTISSEWYEAAVAVVKGPEHPSLKNVYRFRIRDAKDKLIYMIDNIRGKDSYTGKFLEIGPNGNTIVYGDITQDVSANTLFFYKTASGNFLMRVMEGGKECHINLGLDISPNMVIPSEAMGMKVSGIDKNAFNAYLIGVKSVTVPGSIKEIESLTFFYSLSDKLDTLTFGEGMEKLGMYSFACGVKDLYFPSTFKEYDHCPFLKRETEVIHLASTTPPEYIGYTYPDDMPKQKAGEHLGDYETTVVKVPAKALDAYRSHKVWGKYKNLQAE